MANLPPLPIELLEIKIKLQNTAKTEIYPVTSSYQTTSDVIIKTKKLVFDPNATLSFISLDTPYIILYADVIVFNGNANVTRELRDDLTGANGADAPVTPPTPKGAGRNGNDGQPGGYGSAAQNPPRMPVFFLFTRQFLWVDRQAAPSDIRGRVSFKLDGLEGGVGGNGGRGGDGTNGNKGEGPDPGPVWCNSGVGRGGRGGNGGAGGLKGFGSNGGDASAVYFFVDPQQHSIADVFEVSTKGGKPGKNGKPGQPGRPGKGGDPGDGRGPCNDEPGRKGADGGIISGCQYPNIDLLFGADHKHSPSIWDYDNWEELQVQQ